MAHMNEGYDQEEDIQEKTEVNLSKNDWHYKFFRASFNRKAPTNLCPYFWQVAAACVWFPLTAVAYPFNQQLKLVKSDRVADWPMKVLAGAGFWGANTGAYFLGKWLFGTGLIFNWISGLAIIGLTCVVIMGIGYLIVQYEKNRTPEPHTESLLAAKIKATYKENCPHINWN